MSNLYSQRTLKEAITCTGIGLHTGKKIDLTLRPAPPETGIVFVRTDLPGKPQIKAETDNIVATDLATTIGKDGIRISTVEHLLSALYGMGVDNAFVEVDSAEVPIMDGSAAPFTYLIKLAGIRAQQAEKKFFVIKKPVVLREGDREVGIFPAREFRISFTINFSHPVIERQTFNMGFSTIKFEREIARARTFGFLKEVEALKRRGLALGGSLDNAIVVGDFRVLNEEGLRFQDEFVRHKVLDSIGDLSLLGGMVIGHFRAYKSGHTLNNKLVQTLLSDKSLWDLVELKDSKSKKAVDLTPVMWPVPA